MGPLPIPTLDKFAGDLGTFGPVRLDHDEATDELHRRLNVGQYLQSILASEIEMGLARHILAIRGARQELDEIPLLAPDPRGALAHFLLDSRQLSILWSSDHNRGIGLYGDFQR